MGGASMSLTIPSRLAARSNTISRPILFHYIAERAEREAMVAALFDGLERGILTVEDGTAYRLAEAGRAHAALESRRAVGPILLEA